MMRARRRSEQFYLNDYLQMLRYTGTQHHAGEHMPIYVKKRLSIANVRRSMEFLLRAKGDRAVRFIWTSPVSLLL